MMGSRVRWVVGSLMLAAAGGAHAAGNVVISQVYGGGGNSNAPLQNDFVELFNRSASPVNLAGLSVQYASASGTGNFGSQPILALSGTLQPGQYYLIKLASNGAVGSALPNADLTNTSLNISGASGKVALINSTAGLACNGGSNPCSAAQVAQILDLVGYGAANFYENSPVAQLANSTAARRLNSGCVDTDINNADFTTGAPSPNNTASPLNPCGSSGNAPVVSTCPANLAVTLGVGAVANLSANDTDGVVSSAVITSAAVSGISLVNVVPGNPLTAQLQVTAATAQGNYPVSVRFSNSDATPQTATCTIAVNVAPPASSVKIRDIQGSAHISPRNGQSVSGVPGIVTALKNNGFYLQDPNPDGNDATSEGIFVFTNSAPTVSVADSVQVSGTVQEFRPGGSDGLSNLTITEIVSPSVTLVSSGNGLPAPIVLGAGGRAIPKNVIDNDATGSVENSGTFDPTTDAIDFYESLESMRVRINNAVAVGPTNNFGEIGVLADNGVGSGLRTPRGGIVINATDFNPERVILDDAVMSVPSVNVGDSFASVTAVVDYSFGNFKFDITSPITAISASLTAETTNLVGSPTQLTVASFNVENLAANNPPAKFAALAGQFVNALKKPDIVALMEIQDNNGATDNGVVDATQTVNTLIAAIQAAGGPVYQYRSINPVNDSDGGEPGGNIRVGYLFNPARVQFVDRAGGGSTVNTTVVNGANGPQLSASPGRIQPTNSAFASSRKPLAGEFVFNGRKLFLIANHFNSKGGDDPLFGRFQPTVRSSEIQRHQQAAIVNGFVKNILAANANAGVVVLGDLNDFEFSDTLSVLKDGGVLVNTLDTLPQEERYSYVFDGNSQVLDQTLVSPALANFGGTTLDVVHVNAEFATQTSDHDPNIVRFTLPLAGDADGDGDIDRNDVTLIGGARGATPIGPFDARDVNGDGKIDALDTRAASNACTRPGCAQ